MSLVTSGPWAVFSTLLKRGRPCFNIQHVSSAVKGWRLEMDDWPRGQSQLCYPAWWWLGGEAGRKWTWRSVQNIVWQGKSIQAAVPLETESMKVLLKRKSSLKVETVFVIKTDVTSLGQYGTEKGLVTCCVQVATWRTKRLDPTIRPGVQLWPLANQHSSQGCQVTWLVWPFLCKWHAIAEKLWHEGQVLLKWPIWGNESVFLPFCRKSCTSSRQYLECRC